MTLEDPFLPLPPFQAFGIDLPKPETRIGALAIILAALAILALAPVVLVIRLISFASEAAGLTERFQENCAAVFRPEPRQTKEYSLSRFKGTRKGSSQRHGKTKSSRKGSANRR